jgi:hypothetical protein
MDGRPARTKRLIGISTGLGSAKKPPMPFSVRFPRKTFKVYFCSGKVLFIPEIGEIIAFYIVWS